MKIGLITSKHSAAHGDFSKTLRASPYAFKVRLAAASMQGQGTSAEVVAAMNSLTQERVDVICLVRGGGSPVDLAWFDDDAIARAIARCPVPVWVGIGHEIDMTVPDFVAHTRHKTPTAVAEALVALIRALDRDLDVARERLLDVCGRKLELAERTILQNVNGLRQGTRKHLEIHSSRFQARLSKLESTVEARMSDKNTQLGKCQAQLEERVRARTELAEQALEVSDRRVEESALRHLQRAEERIVTKATQLRDKVRSCHDREERDMARRRIEFLAAFGRLIQGRNSTLELKTSRYGIEQYERILDQVGMNLEEKRKRLDALSPERLLARGYSLTRDEQGRLLRSADDVQAGQTVFTQLAKGTITSVVTEKEDKGDDGR